MVIIMQCAVPENIHTSTTERMRSLLGLKGFKGPGNSGGEEGGMVKLTSRCCSKLLRMDLVSGGVFWNHPVLFI